MEFGPMPDSNVQHPAVPRRTNLSLLCSCESARARSLISTLFRPQKPKEEIFEFLKCVSHHAPQMGARSADTIRQDWATTGYEFPEAWMLSANSQTDELLLGLAILRTFSLRLMTNKTPIHAAFSLPTSCLASLDASPVPLRKPRPLGRIST